jgi:hypothetical protein
MHNMNTLEGKNTKTKFGQAIKADASGELPSRIELLQVGVWRTAWHGDFMITPDDLAEYVENFNDGVGLADNGSAGAPIDFGHNSGELAAGWIKSLSTDGNTLFGDVQWSQAGKDAILNDEYKFFSPEFYPKGRGGWMDPEDYEALVDNVLVGGGLTNIPLFKTLGALKASAADGKQERRVSTEYINASELKEKNMTVAEQIADYRKIEIDKLTEEQKTFVTAHAAELTDEDKTYFGLEASVAASTTTNKPKEAEVADPELAKIAASLKSGEAVVIKASELKELKDNREASQKQIDELRQDKISAHVDTAIARGAIKADRKDKWVERIMADQTMQEELDLLPDNQIMADAQGSSVQAGQATKAAEVELHEKTVAAVKASAENGGQALSYSQARKEVLSSDQALAQKINENKE